MLIGVLLFALFFIWACIIWRSTPTLLTESERESAEVRYRYATTPLRRWTVMIGSCLLFAAVFSFITYSVAFLLWSSFLFAWVDTDGAVKLVFFLAMAAVVVAITRIPKLRQFLVESCLFFQRYQFFPPLPSRREESLMQQLERLPAGTVPSEVETVLAAGAEGNEHRPDMYETFRKLGKVHAQLEKIARNHKGVVKRLYFGEEWELIDCQYKAIERQMHANTGQADKALMHQVCICLYYAYGLLTRYIVETSASSDEVRNKFKTYGFDLAV